MTTYLQTEFDTSGGNSWIGFNDIVTEGDWVWTDDSSTCYLNWGTNSPSNSGSGEDCAEYLAGESGKWNDLTCSFSRKGLYQFPMSEYLNVCGQYNCKPGPGNTFTQTCGGTNTPTASPSPCPTESPSSEPLFVCRNSDSDTWVDHKSIAESQNGQLLSILGQDMTDYIAAQFSTGRYFIGLNDIATEDQFVWADGSSVCYQNWADNEPNDCPTLGGEDCGEITSTGEWNDLPCDDVDAAFKGAYYQFPMSEYQSVCSQYDCQPGPGNSFTETCTGSPSTPTACPTASPSSEDLFVCQYRSGNTWENHRDNALSKNGNLLSVLNDEMTTYLLSEYGTSGNSWIGFNDRSVEGQWVWNDDASTCYFNWGTNSPSNSGSGEDCAEFLGGESGKWNDKACSTGRWAYYQFPMSEYQNVCSLYDCQPGPGNTFSQSCGGSPTTPSPTPAPVSSDSLFICQYRSSDTWGNHLVNARSQNGDFLTVVDQDMTDYLQTEYGTSGKYWIGFNDIDTENQFVWSDGSDTSFTKWTNNQPSNSGGNEDCTEYLQDQSGFWNDLPCITNRWAYYQFPMSEYLNVCANYDCKAGPGNSFSQSCGGSPTTPNPTPAPVSSDALFICQERSSDTWGNHLVNARSFGGDLLTVVDQDMTDYIQTEYGTSGKSWIGFNDIDNENQFVWSDGSDTTFTKWTNNQPSNSGGNEDCAEYLNGEDGFWNDRPCTTNRWAYYQFPMSVYQTVCGPFDCKPGPGNTFTETCP